VLPWWAAGAGLASVMLGHWLLTGRMMAVSGRLTATVDRVRFGPPEPELDLSEEDLLAAVRELTAAEFGAEALAPGAAPPELGSEPGTGPAAEPAAAAEPLASIASPPTPIIEHAVFFVAVALGGLLAALWRGELGVDRLLRSSGFAHLSRGDFLAGIAILLFGGVLVGFGTRMGSGCTSGHGLCGTSRAQPGSLLSTAVFFGAAMLASWALTRLYP
jgi:uncharacterized membrane protein YedE/YeeE